jgi:hypothetical protein
MLRGKRIFVHQYPLFSGNPNKIMSATLMLFCAYPVNNLFSGWNSNHSAPFVPSLQALNDTSLWPCISHAWLENYPTRGLL